LFAKEVPFVGPFEIGEGTRKSQWENMVVGGNQAGKGAKGLLMGKGADQGDQKDKKKPISRSSRAGLQVLLSSSSSSSCPLFFSLSPSHILPFFIIFSPLLFASLQQSEMGTRCNKDQSTECNVSWVF
jgi:hypothetical protein